MKNIETGDILNNKVTAFTERNLWQIDESHLYR